MNECEGSVCPFCGKIFGSGGEVKSHLNMTDEEIDKMNKVASRDPNYRPEYIKEKGINEFDMDVKLDDGIVAKVQIGEQIHHIVSVDPYSSTLRVSRLGNLAGFDINELPNLTALPYAKNISDFPEQFKPVIQEKVVEKIEMQYHDGPHNYSEEGLISYEDQMVQKMSEIEQGVLEKSRSAGGCIGKTKEFIPFERIGSDLPDIYTYNIPLISKRFKETLGDAEVSNTFYKSVYLYEAANRSKIEDYYLILVEALDCVDWDKSEHTECSFSGLNKKVV